MQDFNAFMERIDAAFTRDGTVVRCSMYISAKRIEMVKGRVGDNIELEQIDKTFTRDSAVASSGDQH